MAFYIYRFFPSITIVITISLVTIFCNCRISTFCIWHLYNSLYRTS